MHANAAAADTATARAAAERALKWAADDAAAAVAGAGGMRPLQTKERVALTVWQRKEL